MTDKQAKGDRCKALLDDPDLKQAFADVRSRLVEEMVESQGTDDYILDLKKCIHLLDVVQKQLHKAVQDGKLERYAENQTPFLQDVMSNVRH